MLRVAALNGTTLEWYIFASFSLRKLLILCCRIAHEALARKEGMTSKQIAVIRDTSTALTDDVDPGHALSDAQRAALAYADWMTKNVHVPQHVFDALKATVSNDQQIVEVTMTVATYNMVSRFLVSLDVGDKADTKVPEVSVEES